MKSPRPLNFERLEDRRMLADMSLFEPSMIADATHASLEAEIAHPHYNVDVDGDQNVSPVDALQIINELNAPTSDTHSPAFHPEAVDGVFETWANQPVEVDPFLAGAKCDSPPYLDVNGDRMVSPVDALIVINYINEHGAGPAQGVTHTPDCGNATVSIERQPEHGVAILDGNTITYLPNEGFSGTDEVRYAINNGSAQSFGTLRINVQPNASPSLPDNVALQTQPGTPIVIGLFGGDPDGDPVNFAPIFVGDGAPIYGTLSPGNEPNTVIYTPNEGVSDVVDTVFVLGRDGKGGQDFGSFSITIDATDTSPPEEQNLPVVEADGQVDTLSGQPVTFNLGAIHPQGGVLTYTLTYPPQNGAVNIDSDGNVTYTSFPDFAGTDVILIEVNGVQVRRMINVLAA